MTIEWIDAGHKGLMKSPEVALIELTDQPPGAGVSVTLTPLTRLHDGTYRRGKARTIGTWETAALARSEVAA